MSRRPATQCNRGALLLAAMAAGSGSANASPPPLPDDFLEYLGSWDADDADWLVASAAGDGRTPAASVSRQPATAAPQPVHRSTTAPRGTTAAPAPGTERK